MFPSKHYLIRHAHRPKFTPGDWGHETSITEEGKGAANQYGSAFARSNVHAIWTSPIKRCVETAEEIKRGIGREIPVHSSSLLGGPGFPILRPALAESVFQSHSLPELIETLLRGDTLPGFYSIDIGCRRMLRKLRKQSRTPSIWISHDITICLLACWLFHITQVDDMLPGFLEGIEFTFTEKELFARFKHLTTRVSALRTTGG